MHVLVQIILHQHSVSVSLFLHMFIGLVARMVNAMGSRPLRRSEGWGCDIDPHLNLVYEYYMGFDLIFVLFFLDIKIYVISHKPLVSFFVPHST